MRYRNRITGVTASVLSTRLMDTAYWEPLDGSPPPPPEPTAKYGSADGMGVEGDVADNMPDSATGQSDAVPEPDDLPDPLLASWEA
jgi:hypothetical protein